MSTIGELSIVNRETLLVHAMAIESEAVARYEELADQMEVHHNPDVAVFFRKMAEIEGKHVDNVSSLCGELQLPHSAPWDLAWGGDESPEGPLHNDEVHYLMSPHHAIQLAIRGEQRAVDFFTAVSGDSRAPEDVRALALQMTEDEHEHIRLLREWLARYPEPEDGWHEDLDPPAVQE